MKLNFRNHHEMYLYLEGLCFIDCHFDSNYDWCMCTENEKGDEIIITSAGEIIINEEYFDDIENFTDNQFKELIK